MEFRHEYKFQISPQDRQLLLSRLRPLGLEDPHASAGEYRVYSLYFDDLQDTALRQKLDGVENRDKFRLRYYNGDLSFLRLEKKSKRGNLCQKRSASLPLDQAKAVLAGRPQVLKQCEDPLLMEFYARLCRGLRPVTLTVYRREPFVYAGSPSTGISAPASMPVAWMPPKQPWCLRQPQKMGSPLCWR